MSEFSGPERDEVGIRMLCAWNNVARDQARPDWSSHANEWTRDAWARVYAAARQHVLESLSEPTEFMISECSQAIPAHLDTLPAKKATWRVDERTKCIIRWKAMLRAVA